MNVIGFVVMCPRDLAGGFDRINGQIIVGRWRLRAIGCPGADQSELRDRIRNRLGLGRFDRSHRHCRSKADSPRSKADSPTHPSSPYAAPCATAVLTVLRLR